MDTAERTIMGLIVLLAILAFGVYVFNRTPQTAYIPAYSYTASPIRSYTYTQPSTTTYSYSNYPRTTTSSASNYTTYELPPQTTYTVTDVQY